MRECFKRDSSNNVFDSSTSEQVNSLEDDFERARIISRERDAGTIVRRLARGFTSRACINELSD